MTTLTQFTPSTLTPFSFQAALDGVTYNVIVTWNIYRKGWYLSVFDANGNRILTRSMVASPPGYDISLVAGYFTTSKLVFREATQIFEVTP